MPTAPGGGGRVGLMRAADHDYRVLGPLDGPIEVTDFDEPVDIAVVEDGDGMRACFVYTNATASSAADCRAAHGGRCSGMRWITWNGAGDVAFGAERGLERGGVRHIAISRDRRLGFITRSGGSEIMVWDFGDGGFERFERHALTPSIQSVSRPAAIWIP